MSPIMEPFCHLLKPNTPFVWDSVLKDKFVKAKEKIVDGIRFFGKSHPTCLATDWCKSGLGFFPLQKHCECKLSGLRCCRGG